MREKHPRLVVAFHTTTAAMAFEAYCGAHQVPGRLIPVPREITAGFAAGGLVLLLGAAGLALRGTGRLP